MKLNLIVIILVLLFSNCANNSVPNSDDNIFDDKSNFFPLTVGSWWKYKVSYDPLSEDFDIDSTVAERKIQIDGKEAFELISYIKNKYSYEILYMDTSYYYKDETGLYKYMLSSNTNEPEWLLFADFKLDYLKIFEYPISLVIGQDSLLNGVEKMERFSEGMVKFYLGNKTLDCIKTKINVSYSGELSYDNNKKANFSRINLTEYQWYAYNVGLTRVSWHTNDFDRTIVDYHIEQTE
jgi:hypothetical protein